MRKKTQSGRTTYSKEFKLKVVEMYMNGWSGSTTIARELGIPIEKTVLCWVYKYRQFGEAGLEEHRGKTKSPRRGRPRKNPIILEQCSDCQDMENLVFVQ